MEHDNLFDNNNLNNFLQKYNEKDRKNVLEKLEKIGLLFLSKNTIKKDFYTFDDLDNIISILEKNIIPENENSNNENIKSDNLNIDDLNNLKEPDDNEEIKDENMIKENPKEFEKTKYAYAFKDFDASTGFHLRSALNDKDREYIVHIANFIYAKAHGTLHKKYKRIKKKK
jgi:hypothetical protein